MRYLLAFAAIVAVALLVVAISRQRRAYTPAEIAQAKAAGEAAARAAQQVRARQRIEDRQEYARNIEQLLRSNRIADRVEAREDADGPTIYLYTDGCSQELLDEFVKKPGGGAGRNPGFRRVSCEGRFVATPPVALLR